MPPTAGRNFNEFENAFQGVEKIYDVMDLKNVCVCASVCPTPKNNHLFVISRMAMNSKNGSHGWERFYLLCCFPQF